MRNFRALAYPDRSETVAAFLRHPRLTIDDVRVSKLQSAWANVIKEHAVVEHSVGLLPEGLTMKEVAQQVLPVYSEYVRNDMRSGEFDDYGDGWMWKAVDEMDVLFDPSEPSTIASMAQHLDNTFCRRPSVRIGFCCSSNQFYRPVFTMIDGDDVAILQAQSADAYDRLQQILAERKSPKPIKLPSTQKSKSKNPGMSGQNRRRKSKATKNKRATRVK